MVARDDRLPSTAARRPPPSHPPYALMIGEAIRSLGERRGSTEPSISEYIRGNFEGLPWGHDRLLPFYLHKLTGEGEFVEGDGGRYRIAQDDGGGASEEEGPDSSRSQSESQLFEKRGVNGEDDVEALNRAVPAAREAETGGGDGDQGIADIDDGDDDAAAAVEPEPPMSGPLQRGTKRTESVEVVANVDDDDDDAAEEPEPPPLQTEGWIENHSSEDGSKDDVDVADPLQRQTKQTVSVEAVANVDAAAATAEEPEPPPLPTGGRAENQSSEDVAEDLLQSHRVLPVCEGANVDEDDTQTLQCIAHEDDAAEEPAPPLAKACREFVENHNFEDDSNNEERNIDNDVIEPLQSIVLTPSQPETEGIENAEAIANVNNDDDEGVPIACEGDLVMKVQSLAIFLGPRNELESPNCNGGNSELVHELSRMSLMEPQEAESEAKKNNGVEGSESKPKRRGRPPKKRRTHSSSIGSSTAIGDQDGDLERIQNSIVVSEPICPSGDVVVEPLQALVPHQEPINVDGAEKDLALVQSEPQKSVPKRRGRPPKRKLEAMDSSKKVMVLYGDVEPIQVVDPSSLGTNDNVVKLPVPEKTSGNKDDGSKPVPERRRRQSKKKHESVDTSEEVIFHDGGVEPLQSVNPSPLGADDNVKFLVYEEAAGKKGDGLQPKRRGRPPKRKHESTDRSKNVMPNDGDVEPPPKRRRKSKKSSNQNIGGDGPTAVPAEPISTKVGFIEAIDPKECVELQKDQKESNPVPKHRGRPPKNKLIMGGSEDTPKVVARRVEKTDKKSFTSVPKRRGRPPKPKPNMGDKWPRTMQAHHEGKLWG